MLQTAKSRLKEINAAMRDDDLRLKVGGNFQDLDNVFDRGLSNLVAGKPIIFPVCLGNSYFSSQQIQNMIGAFRLAGNTLCVFIANGPATYNFLALGKDQKSAEVKAISEGKKLRKRVEYAIAQLGPEFAAKTSIIDSTTTIPGNLASVEKEKFIKLYKENDLFRHDVQTLTKEVLLRRYYLEANAETIETAKDYTLEELAFVAASPRILNTDGICFAYHKGWEIFTKWADGFYDGEARPAHGFIACDVTKGNSRSTSPAVTTIEAIEKMSSRHIGASLSAADDGIIPISPAIRIKAHRPPVKGSGTPKYGVITDGGARLTA